MEPEIVQEPEAIVTETVTGEEYYETIIQQHNNQFAVLQESLHYIRTGFVFTVFISVLIIVLIFSNTFKVR